jgi:hypothetical protein
MPLERGTVANDSRSVLAGKHATSDTRAIPFYVYGIHPPRSRAAGGPGSQLPPPEP